jgi:hypothetical protein
MDGPEEIEAGMHALLMKSSGSIGYGMKIFMKTVAMMWYYQSLHLATVQREHLSSQRNNICMLL